MRDDHDPQKETRTDPQWPTIERALARLGAPPAEPDWSLVTQVRAPRRVAHPTRWVLAAAAGLALLAGTAWWRTRDAWLVHALAGAPRLIAALPFARGLSEGARLETGPGERARLEIGSLGIVDLDPDSRVRRVRGLGAEHRLALEQGRLHAVILAPPRQFVVETPSAVATDLGCAYTLEVTRSGDGMLIVQSGWVAFERDGRETFVPAGARCATWRDSGPGTPYQSDAPEPFVASLARLDQPLADVAARRAALQVVLRLARTDDAFTLWHLLTRVPVAERGAVMERLVLLAPPPEGVTRERVLVLEPAALDAWWDALGMGNTSWWRLWKSDAPPTPR